MIGNDRHDVESYQSCLSDKAVRPVEEGFCPVATTANDHRAGFVDAGRRLALGCPEDIVHDFGPLDEVSFWETVDSRLFE